LRQHRFRFLSPFAVTTTMFGPSVRTLIVITHDRLIRADFASRAASEPELCASSERPDMGDLPGLVSIAISLVPRKPRRVVVLASDFWTQTIEIAGVSTASDEELEQILAFEAEPLSSISAFEAVTAAVSLGQSGGTRRYWVTQTLTSARNE